MYYKYRGIKDFRYFVDILLNKRLYAAPYYQLNDPMEGHYLYSTGELDSDILNLIEEQKNRLRICSLSSLWENELMWAHYAEGHRGVVIGVEINEYEYSVVPIRYTGVKKINKMDISNSTAKDILSHKLNVWSYEKEVRVFVERVLYVNVTVNTVILGRGMANQDIGFIKNLVQKIDDNIQVVGMQEYSPT